MLIRWTSCHFAVREAWRPVYLGQHGATVRAVPTGCRWDLEHIYPVGYESGALPLGLAWQEHGCVDWAALLSAARAGGAVFHVGL